MNIEQDRMRLEPNMQECRHLCGVKCISWSAIVVGALIAIGIGFLLDLFSIAIGLSIYKTNPEGVRMLASGGVIALAVGGIATMFFAGWVAGYLGRQHCFKRNCGGLYGLTTWCLALVVMVLMTAPLGRFVSSYSNFIANPSVATFRTHENVPVVVNNTAPDQRVAVNPEVAANDLSKGAFIAFLLLFLGALAATAGGHCGVSSCRKDKCDPSCKGKCDSTCINDPKCVHKV